MGNGFEKELRRTKIVATLGPASSELGVIKELISAGTNVFRCNFSHGDFATHAKLIATIRQAAAELGSHVAIMQDLQGPKIRVGELAGGGPIQLVPGQEITVTEEDVEGNQDLLPVPVEGMINELRQGETILLADGTKALEVISITGKTARCRVVIGGEILPHKGVNLPKTRLTLPCLTEKDLTDLEFGLSQDVDYVALSFVRKPEDLFDLKERIKQAGSSARVVAKMERPEAVNLSEEILDATDVAMVARGDLGVELGAERVPLAQKQIIQRAREKGVPVITATEMLETMIHASRPTRAEASDVANAIQDGTSAVMLSGETAMGDHPVEVVRTMNRIARYAERTLATPQVVAQDVFFAGRQVTEAVVRAACTTATKIKAKALVVFTLSGTTARLVARYGQRVPVLAFTNQPMVQRQMSFYWGVEPILFSQDVENPHDMVEAAVGVLKTDGYVEEGDRLVIVAGEVDVKGATNSMRVWTV